MLKRQKKHIDKEQGKTKHEAPRSVNYRTTQNKNYIKVWLQQGKGDVGIFLSVLKQSWHNELQDSSIAIFYRNISDFHLQNYHCEQI